MSLKLHHLIEQTFSLLLGGMLRLGYYLLRVSHDMFCGIGEDEMRAGTWIEDSETISVS